MTPRETDQLLDMASASSLFAHQEPSLKICGITSSSEAQRLVDLKVPALGLNFWPKSKRYWSPELALTFSPSLAGVIERVGVFVNNAPELAPQLFDQDVIDIVQLHGDEDDSVLVEFLSKGIPTIRALSLPSPEETSSVITHYRQLASEAKTPLALLLDAHAPGLYGGTGETIDWKHAKEFITLATPLPILLAGGITPNNAARALTETEPAGLDIASGAEISPGKKDFVKVEALLQTISENSSVS